MALSTISRYNLALGILLRFFVLLGRAFVSRPKEGMRPARGGTSPAEQPDVYHVVLTSDVGTSVGKHPPVRSDTHYL